MPFFVAETYAHRVAIGSVRLSLGVFSGRARRTQAPRTDTRSLPVTGSGERHVCRTRRPAASSCHVVPVGGVRETGLDNYHRGADQWLLVVEGTRTAIIDGRKLSLKPGKMVLIEAGDRHEIRNTGRSLLKTVSVYAPPAYRNEETELPAGRAE